MIRTFALIAAVSTLALTAFPAGAKPQRSDRETAIRECNAARSGYSNHGWGVRGDAIYRACMADRGQPE
jgi:hypothetical protein